MSLLACVCVYVCSAETSGPAAGGASVWPAESKVEQICGPSLPAPLLVLPALPRVLHHHRLPNYLGEDKNNVLRVLVIWLPY